MAYSIVNCGILPALAVGLLRRRPEEHPRVGWTMAAILLGGTCGLIASVLDAPPLAIAGTATSFALSALAHAKKHR